VLPLDALGRKTSAATTTASKSFIMARR